ncbi:MAG: PE-PPE-like protein [Mycobacterium sp.]|nr:PE-PPE-like protein [Mycobacterium sp.]
MRRTTRSIGVVLISIVAALGLVVGSAFSAALAFGAVTALIVPGTGTHNILPPNAVTGYKENAANRYINESGVPCSSTDGCNLQGVDYPASFFPVGFIPGWCPGYSCDTWNQSVGTGVTNLNTALTTALGTGTDPIIIFGYSQGGAVVSREMYDIPDSAKSRVSVVTIGNINNPLGLWSRLSFLPTIPGLDISFGPQLPTNNGVTSTNYSFQYDPVGDAPQYWGNAFAVLNALAAFVYVHGYYLDPTSNAPTASLPYGYSDATLANAISNTTKRTYGDASFVLIPQQGALPLYQPIVDLGKQFGISALVNPLVALVNPLTKLLVDLGYDRATNPGIARTLSLLPFNPFAINPIQFAGQVVQAIVQGVQDALAGGASLTPPTTVTPPSAAQTPVTTLVAKTSVEKKQSVVTTTAVAATEESKRGTEEQTTTTQSAPEKVVTEQVPATKTATTARSSAGTTPVAAVEENATKDQDAADAAAAAAKDAAAQAKDAAAQAKDAADKAAKDGADKAAAATSAADNAAKAATEKAKQSAAANGAASTGSNKTAADTTKTTDTSTGTSDTGDSEKKAA